MLDATVIGRALGGQPRRHNWDCQCPRCGYSLSLTNAEDGRLLAYCVGGCEYNDIEAALVNFDVDQPCRVTAPEPDEADRALRIEKARQIYQAAKCDSPLVPAYLRSRSISIAPPELRLLRGHPFPAMTAPIVNSAGDIVAVHLTFLKPDGSGQAYSKPASGPDPRRRCYGVVRGGVIRLATHDPGEELIVAEGIETTLSAMQLFGLPGWSAVSAGGVKRAVLPEGIRRLLIVADNDENGCSQRNAVEAARQWQAEGREVRIWKPSALRDDANDVLIKRKGR